MYKIVFYIVFFVLPIMGFAQTQSKDFRSKKLIVKKDTIQLDSVAINPQKFKILNHKQIIIPAKEYTVNFSDAILVINSKKYSKITVEYFRFPDFVTKTYSPFNSNLIVPNNTNTGKLYSLTTNKKVSDIKLFNGLQTKGFITRGVTVGNNQNAVTNAALDLEISGKLSKNVSIRANIYDTNIPLQQNGYSQNITDFDRIFIEFFSKNWSLKAGDISLENSNTHFFNFTKQIAGLKATANVNKHTTVTASGAIVKGKFSRFNFIGKEGNQGPYKIVGSNNEPNIIIIAGSETVYVNGIAITRGKNKDYSIDYNLSEIRFNTSYPITKDMRITVEFQYSDRNYTRFVTFEKASYKSDKFNINGYFYNENDSKNQPIQQNLTATQKQILANAGNKKELMVAESAFKDVFSENKILYKKLNTNTINFFEYSTDANQTLYNVTFTNVGKNNGAYSLEKTIATGNIFKYVGANNGNFAPVVRLTAPTKSQIVAVNSTYQPNKKTKLYTELAFTNNDLNLFSAKGNNQNKGMASLIGWQQTILNKKWQLTSDVKFEYKHANFFTEHNYEPIEFKRDWNLASSMGNKKFVQSSFLLKNKKQSFLYGFNFLSYTKNFTGYKHIFSSKISDKNTSVLVDVNLLNGKSTLEKNTFLQLKTNAEHHFTKSWIGFLIDLETNKRKHKATQQFYTNSHKYQEYQTYFGFGDTTKVYTKIGLQYRNNDSIKANKFTAVNNRKTLYIQSKILENKYSNLSIYANYSINNNVFYNTTKSINSKILYNQNLFDNFLSFSTLYETASGNVPKQDYIYVETEPGQGYYTWFDYNNNGVKDFNEFEIAKFKDQAKYLRVPLPNLRYTPTQRVKWNQSLTINPSKWQHKNGAKKLFSHFYNQSFIGIENERERVENSFNFNPFNFDDNKLLTLNFSIRNNLFFNRNLQKYSTTYTYLKSKNKQLYFIGNQNNTNTLHQVTFSHKFSKFWLFDIMGNLSKNILKTENYTNRNYNIYTTEIQPKFSFLYHKNHRFSAFYQFTKKENRLQNLEKLQQQKIGLEYFVSKEKNQISANLNAFFNDFTGNANSPVAYQMLEGLQTGRNFTWNLLFNRQLNAFLHLHINYLGRKSKNSKTIHTGSIQLRAVF